MDTNSKIKTQCLDCKRETNHEIVATKLYDNYSSHDYHHGDEYSIVKCLGCDHVSFLKTFHDYEAVYRYGPGDDEYDHPRSFTNYYPNASRVLFKSSKYLPRKLHEVYVDTNIAFNQKLYLFTAIGIRAIIECICKDKKVSGRDLEKKITNLKNLGNVSKRDVELLHSLRFLGNDAVHELFRPEHNDIKVAFDIIEHLIQSIYVMPSSVNGANFKIHLDEYDKFEEFILNKITNDHQDLDCSISLTIKKIIDPKGKVPYAKFEEFQEKLNSRIKSGDIKFLEITPTSKMTNASDETYYTVKTIVEQNTENSC